MAAAASSSFSSSKFSPDSPPRLSLTPDQFKQCSEALSFFREKLRIPHTITQEFAHLQANRITPSEMRRNCTVAFDSVNSSKNRYSDVIPFDKNRVVLNSCKDYRPAARGYINASLITTSSSENISQFIATQGPLPQTYEDFWEMVMQYRCPVVVMLTTLVDNYQIVKCGDYFQAEDGPKEFGNTHIVTKWIKTTDTSIVLRHLEVKYKEANGITPSEMRRSCTVALDSVNLSKNRYSDVIPFDKNRVVLNSYFFLRKHFSVYCHTRSIATNLRGFLGDGNAVPLLDGKMWRLFFKLKMVTGNLSEEEPMSVLHIQYPEWSDHRVPKDTIAVREILKRIYLVPPNLGPVLVHRRYWENRNILRNSNHNSENPSWGHVCFKSC